MTAKDIIDRAWAMLDDPEGGRNPVGEMITKLNDGIVDICMRRPYLLLDEAGAFFARPVVTAANVEEALPFEDGVREPLAHFTCAKALMVDAQDEHNQQLAVSHFTRYSETT